MEVLFDLLALVQLSREARRLTHRTIPKSFPALTRGYGTKGRRSRRRMRAEPVPGITLYAIRSSALAAYVRRYRRPAPRATVMAGSDATTIKPSTVSESEPGGDHSAPVKRTPRPRDVSQAWAEDDPGADQEHRQHGVSRALGRCSQRRGDARDGRETDHSENRRCANRQRTPVQTNSRSSGSVLEVPSPRLTPAEPTLEPPSTV
jgi:hypothetical protein